MIYTLYSFKGGVGRSMALANLAAYFCRKGLRVLMIDWDLEAPGLESYFYPTESRSLELAQAAARPGLIDLLLEYKSRFPSLLIEAQLQRREANPDLLPDLPMPTSVETVSPTDLASQVSEASIREAEEVARITREFREQLRAAKKGATDGAQATAEPRQPVGFGDVLDRNFPSIESYLQPIDVSGPGALWLLGAGARSPETFGTYAEAVQDFDWLEFIASYEGKAYLEWLRRKLASFDVVLIDSRTGVTEMGGICTRQMADAVVAFCAPNNQNVEGVDRIIHSLDTDAARKARHARHLQILVIPTRLDDSESGLLGKFSEQFGDRFEKRGMLPEALQELDRPLWNLQIPYIPKFNFRERLVIDPGPPATEPAPRADPPTEKLIKAYETIALHLAVLAASESSVRAALQSEIAGAFPHLLPQSTPRMAAPLPGNWVERPAAAAALKNALLQCARAPKGGRLGIWGQAGAGKTTLLARVCQDAEVAAAFPDGIIWLTLEGAWGTERVQEFLRTQFAVARSGGRAALARALNDRKFLFVVDDVWTTDQLDAVFEFGHIDSRVIVTRDLGTASEFSATVMTIGKFTPEESAELLKIPPSMANDVRADPALKWLVDWPLGASLLRAALERQTAQSGGPEKALGDLRAQLQRSGLRLLDQPSTPGRNGSLDLSFRESLGRLSPEVRRLLMKIASKDEPVTAAMGPAVQQSFDERSKRITYRPPAQLLVDLGLAVVDRETLRPEETVGQWLNVHRELFGESDDQRQRQRSETLKRGYDLLHGTASTLKELESLAYAAKDFRDFALARKLLALVRQHTDFHALPPAGRLKVLQQHALCTYKDEDLVADERLTQAFQILTAADLQDPNPSQETFGLAGSIYKQRWRTTGQRGDLERSLRFYQRGASGPLAGDFGYTRVNAAFLLDQLAGQEALDFPETALARRRQASQLREDIISGLPNLAAQPANAWLKAEWWYGATIAECLFGVGRFAEARYWLREALALDPPAWQLESTTRQLSLLARAQGVDTAEDSDAWRTIAMLVGDATEALRAMRAGKVGLALSGGGFRASLFHIGVLARLAELDVLRHVDVLSCVSGGSIIGAHYYLEVRRLLRDKRDREITRLDYIDIVKRIQRDFLAGVRMNLRSRLLAGWIANLRSVFVPGYTRTRYLGDLFERHIYSRVRDGEDAKRHLSALQIVPKDGGPDFNPKLDNWRRAAKVPILLLNATTLNTGHVWQFAVNWMGEPPVSASSSVDSNDILRRMYYKDAPGRHRAVRLGQAVSASACVPGLFDPVEMDELFPRRRVRLVDGGVHDNQGIAGLLEQECSVVLVSDASGQMNSERTPSDEIVSTFLRTQNISMARIRETEFVQLNSLRRSSALAGLMFLHLKKDLDSIHVDWLDCREPHDSGANPGVRRGTTLTTYGMPKNIQMQLAGLRTDLDTFSDAESYALMLSGYRMAASEFPVPELTAAESSPEAWDFLAIEPVVDRAIDFEPEHERLGRVLAVGTRLSLKVWRLRPLASIMALLPALAVLALAVGVPTWLFSVLRPSLALLPPHVGDTLLVVFAAVVAYLLVLWRSKRKSLTVIATGLFMITIGWFFARMHLWFFDPLYRGAGAVSRRDRTTSA